MKITYEDKSYVELSKSNVPDRVYLTIVAKSLNNPRELIANSVELTTEQLLALCKSVA